MWREMAVVLALQLGCLMWHKQCRGLLSYFSFPELRQFGAALNLATVGLLALWAVGVGAPRNVILVNALLSFTLLSGFRGLLRLWRERSAGDDDAPADPPARVGIIGAGTTGAQLALELAGNRQLGRIPIAFFDDDSQKWQKHIHEVPVVGMPECLLDGWTEKLDEVVIAMPGASEDRIQEISQLLGKTGLKSYTVSSTARFWANSKPCDSSFTPAYATITPTIQP
jgi:FlaA1/EpsC-like NDP-sugar epimerase